MESSKARLEVLVGQTIVAVKLEVTLLDIEVRQEHHKVFSRLKIQQHEVKVQHIEVNILFVRKAY